MRSLLDCACPTTVTGMEWLKTMISRLTEKDNKSVKIFPSSCVYKFGGGKKRSYKYIFRAIWQTLLIVLGNTSLKAVRALLYISEQKAVIMSEEVQMREEKTGIFQLRNSRVYQDGRV